MVVRGFDRDEDGNFICRCNGGISDIRGNYGPSPLAGAFNEYQRVLRLNNGMFGIGNTAPRDLNSGVIATRDEEGREVNIVMQPDGSATSIGTTVSSGEEIGQANSDQIAHDQRINIQSSPSNAINPYYQEFRRLLDSGQIRTPVISTVDNNLDIRTNTSMDRLESLGIRQNSLGQEERDRNVELSQTSSRSKIDRASDLSQTIDNLYRQSEEQFSTMLRGTEAILNNDNSFFDLEMLERMTREAESAVRFEGDRLNIDTKNHEFLHRHSGLEKILKRDGHVVIDEEDWKRARELLNDSDILKIEDIYGGQG